ncbi:MAG: alpha-2-macroglobulin [Leptospiraceae bacterium]|nr:peptidase inhibitor [Leptospiraceae bacterium]MCP5510524.1 alpha-2-macroglobulin [Leptospiraceae bacterium]
MKQLYFSLLVYLLSLISIYSDSSPSILNFSPTGEIRNVEQVKVQFSHSMIPFGDPRAKVEPFDVICSEQGKGRWLDDKNFVFEFTKKISAGNTCIFTLKKDIKTLAGKEITGVSKFSFNTGGPAIYSSKPYEGSYIEEDQYFYLQTDCPVDEESIIEKAYFSVQGSKEKYPVEIVTGSPREDLIKKYSAEKKQERILLLKSKLTFPTDKQVQLIWPKGIRSKSGLPTSSDQKLSYQVRSPFTASFSCERENANSDCIPLLPMTLSFSSNFPIKFLKDIVIRSGKQTFTPEQINSENETSISYLTFRGPFPENSELTLEVPKSIQDDTGRSLQSAKKFPLKIKTDKYPALAKFPARFGILEWEKETALPVTIRNLEKKVKTKLASFSASSVSQEFAGKQKKITPKEIVKWIQNVNYHNRDTSIFQKEKNIKTFTLPQTESPEAFQVVGIPISEPGFHVIEIESKVLGKKLLNNGKPMYVPTSVLVTDMAVHFKQGRESSLVWVTSLSKGKPVPSADVRVLDCNNKELYKGKTNSDGILNLQLPSAPYCNNSYYQYNNGYFVTAEKGKDFSFVHSGWTSGIETWRYNLPGRGYKGSTPNIAHTILDRPLFRAGEKVNMKHILRTHFAGGFKKTDPNTFPGVLTIRHQGSDQKYTQNLKWTTGGISLSEWEIPKEAKLGNYQIELSSKSNTYYSGEFRVEEFRIPILKGVIQSPPEKQVKKDGFNVDVLVTYLSGGAASNLPIKFKSFFNEYGSHNAGRYNEYRFLTDELKEGKKTSPEYYYDYDPDSDTGASAANPMKIISQEGLLDGSGSATMKVTNIPSSNTIISSVLELEYRDPNGEIQTISQTIPVYPSEYIVGIKNDSWISSPESAKVQIAVLNLDNKPIKNWPVTIEAYERKYYSNRKRMVGGFYSYDSIEEIQKLSKFCEGKTNDAGILICEGVPPKQGNIIFQARIEDPKGNPSYSQNEVYVPGSDEGYWSSYSDNDRMDLLPEKKEYKPGEIAKFQAKLPFSESTALITIEREGVLNSRIETIKGKDAIIEIPITGEYAPNVFVSVLAVRGRLGKIKPSGLIDLGKPSHKLGLAGINVGWEKHKLEVHVETGNSKFKVREKVNAHIKVTPIEGKLDPDSEVAIAVVDEGLLELIPNKTWKILDEMMGSRYIEVSTSTAQMQVVGKRHFGLKSVPQGGGGGQEPTRELFDTLLHWKGSVKLNKNGEADIEFPTNDSLTSYRIVAIATSGLDKFGTGSSSFQTTQDLMMFSGISPIAREGDEFRAEISLRNTTDKSVEINIMGKTNNKAIGDLSPQKINLSANETKQVYWDVKVPNDVRKIDYKFYAEGQDSKDSITIKQNVIPAVPVRVFQATLTQIDKEYKVPVQIPEDAIPGRGDLSVYIDRTLLSSLGGVKNYMNQYPYTCMEQKVSKAVSLKNLKQWDAAMKKLPAYLDEDGFVKYFPNMYRGSSTLTAYILAIANERNWKIPEDSKNHMITALTGFVNGSLNRNSSLPTADLTIRKLEAIEALSRYNSANPSMLSALQFDPNLIPTSSVLDYWNILDRMDIQDKNQKMKKNEAIIRSRLNMQGTIMKFSTERSDSLYWLMVSPDMNSVKLLLTLVRMNIWKEDIGRIVRGALSRQKKGRWDLTTANAWGTLAMEKFARAYEKEPVSGTTHVRLGELEKNQDWKKNKKGNRISLKWPSGKEELNIEHEGFGKPWAIIQSKAAIPLKESLFSGFRIEKSMRNLESSGSDWKKGDLVRIQLKIKADTDMTWVVVNDPIPAGATILSGGIRTSESATASEVNTGYVYPIYEERSFDSYKVYYEYVADGEWTLEYTIRLNQDGVFQLPTTRVEAMYAPEMFGELPNEVLKIKE